MADMLASLLSQLDCTPRAISTKVWRPGAFGDISNMAYWCNDIGDLPGGQPPFHEFRESVDSFSHLAPISHASMQGYTLSTRLGRPYRSGTRPHGLQFTKDTVLSPVLLFKALDVLTTGYAGAVSVHEQLPGPVQLTRNGTGHFAYESYTNKTSKFTRIMDDDMVDLKLPEPDTVVST